MKQKLIAVFLATVPVLALGNTHPVECLRDTKRPSLSSVLTQEKAIKLCAGSKSYTATIDCFKDAIRSSGLNLDVDSAIELCRER